MMMDALEESRDARLLSWLGMDALEERTVRSYRSLMQYLRPGHPWETLPDARFLCRIEAARETGRDTYHPTAAGLLMFGKEEHILLEFPEYSLTCQEAKVSGGNLFTFYYRVWRKLTELPGMRKERADEEMTMERALRDALANCLINCDYRSGAVSRSASAPTGSPWPTREASAWTWTEQKREEAPTPETPV